MDPPPPTAAGEPQRRVPLAALVVAGWAVLRELQLAFAAGGFGNDVNGYFGYARAWAEGRIPYVDYQVEYPPGALIFFLLPFLAGGRERYIKSFVFEMAVFDFACLLLVLAFAERLYPGERRRQALCAAVYLAATALLHPVLYARFDLAPAAIAAAALFFWAARPGASAALLGLGGAVKVWPLALAPLWVGAAYRKSGSRGALRTAGLIALGYCAPALLLLPRAGGHVLEFLRFHTARGLQIESTWGSLALAFGGGPVFEYGAWDVQCRACEALAKVSIPALLLLVILPQALLLARPAEPDARRVLTGVAAVITGFLIAGKVLSPQFVLWLCPLLAVAGAPAQGMLVAVAALTSLTYPMLYPALVDARTAGHALAIACVFARNLLLVAVYGWLLTQLRARPRPA